MIATKLPKVSVLTSPILDGAAICSLLEDKVVKEGKIESSPSQEKLLCLRRVNAEK